MAVATLLLPTRDVQSSSLILRRELGLQWATAEPTRQSSFVARWTAWNLTTAVGWASCWKFPPSGCLGIFCHRGSSRGSFHNQQISFAVTFLAPKGLLWKQKVASCLWEIARGIQQFKWSYLVHDFDARSSKIFWKARGSQGCSCGQLGEAVQGRRDGGKSQDLTELCLSLMRVYCDPKTLPTPVSSHWLVGCQSKWAIGIAQTEFCYCPCLWGALDTLRIILNSSGVWTLAVAPPLRLSFYSILQSYLCFSCRDDSKRNEHLLSLLTRSAVTGM